MCPKCGSRERRRLLPRVYIPEIELIVTRKGHHGIGLMDVLFAGCGWKKAINSFFCVGCGYELGRYG